MNHKIYPYLPEEAKTIRETVFMKEQGFELEFDDVDDYAQHIVIFDEGKPVATCRYFEKERFYIGRVCVLKEYRGQHLGAKLLEIAEDKIREQANEAYLTAQKRVSDFYARCGYKEEGTPYMDEGVPHILMHKELG